jgi:site-specific DNA-methyltransferase (adenine-specific)
MIYHGDCLDFLCTPGRTYKTIFADPPDNIDYGYDEYDDNMPEGEYINWIYRMLDVGCDRSNVFWFSHNAIWLPHVMNFCRDLSEYQKEWKLIIWRYTFGQHNSRDFGSGFRPILRLADVGWRPDVSGIHIKSRRQELGDKRANPKGRVPDNVWEYSLNEFDFDAVWDEPRVVGNAKQRRRWHPTQHPEQLMERIVLCSGGPVFDMFGGTGTTLRVCKRLGIDCDITETSENYCRRISEETGEPYDSF